MKSIDLRGGKAWTFHRLNGCMEEHQIPPVAVFHIGAHHGQEAKHYINCNFEKVYYVEPEPNNFSKLRAVTSGDPRFELYHCAIGSIPGIHTFQKSARSVGGSLNLHSSEIPRGTFEVEVRTGAELQVGMNPRPNVIVIDTQGTEFDALTSVDMYDVQMVIIETAPDGIDLPAAQFWEVEAYLRDFFTPVEQWVHDGYPAVDTVFVRSDCVRT